MLTWVDSAQEALDTALIAYRVAEDRRMLVPLAIRCDGAFLTHSQGLVQIPTAQQVKKFLPPYNRGDLLLHPGRHDDALADDVVLERRDVAGVQRDPAAGQPFPDRQHRLGGEVAHDLVGDLEGVARAVELPRQETERRWHETTPQWPILHACFDGITRDQMIARHKSNHIQVVYAPDEKKAHRACRIKAAMMAELGLEVHFCGNVNIE